MEYNLFKKHMGLIKKHIETNIQLRMLTCPTPKEYSDDPYYYHSPDEEEKPFRDIDQEADMMQRVRDMK